MLSHLLSAGLRNRFTGSLAVTCLTLFFWGATPEKANAWFGCCWGSPAYTTYYAPFYRTTAYRAYYAPSYSWGGYGCNSCCNSCNSCSTGCCPTGGCSTGCCPTGGCATGTCYGGNCSSGSCASGNCASGNCGVSLVDPPEPGQTQKPPAPSDDYSLGGNSATEENPLKSRPESTPNENKTYGDEPAAKPEESTDWEKFGNPPPPAPVGPGGPDRANPAFEPPVNNNGGGLTPGNDLGQPSPGDFGAPEPGALEPETTPAPGQEESPFGAFKPEQPKANSEFEKVEVRKPDTAAATKAEKEKAPEAAKNPESEAAPSDEKEAEKTEESTEADKTAPVSTPEETDAKSGDQSFGPLELNTRLSLYTLSAPARTRASQSATAGVALPKLVRTKPARSLKPTAKVVSR